MDKFRDKTRDNLYGNLINLGIDCKLAKRKIVEEKLFNSWYQRSLGIIEINENTPIKYINILKKDGGKDNPPRWWHYFAVPSEKIRSKALEWSITRGARSGRVAWQFIQNIAGETNTKIKLK